MSNFEIAKTIGDQMGGIVRIKAMTGAKNFVAVYKGLRFSFPNARPKPNSVTVLLTPADEYEMIFHRDGSEYKRFEGIYAEDLKRLFEETTGLYLSL